MLPLRLLLRQLVLMVLRNDITGDTIKSRANTKKYRDAYDAIFYKNSPKKDNDGINGRSDIRVHNESPTK